MIKITFSSDCLELLISISFFFSVFYLLTDARMVVHLDIYLVVARVVIQSDVCLVFVG